MNVECIQETINSLNYWDSEVVDMSINYFGDEVSIVIACNDLPQEKGHKPLYNIIKFILCYQVEYKTDVKDAVWRNNIEVRNMNRRQLGHYMQDIQVKKVNLMISLKSI